MHDPKSLFDEETRQKQRLLIEFLECTQDNFEAVPHAPKSSSGRLWTCPSASNNDNRLEIATLF
ncbi:MAG: hypothetical protein PHE27_00900 [Alphaproteobacteria bacterium]|nr:hypothetical protein [Alphaproteobacteria bacterium]